jgi:uncharacterized protein (TIGR00266 family)
MQVATRQTPSFGVARLSLSPGEPVRVESGAMMAMSAGVELQAKAEGGIMKSLKRAALGGESFFITTYTAPAQGGWVDVAARLPGDLLSFELDGSMPLVIQRGSWLASAQTVQLDTQFGGMKNMFGGEGAFVMKASGQGPVVVACYGALETWDLGPGQGITVDTGHMVAYEERVQVGLRKASGGGLVQSFKSGEGLVFDFLGPGRVMTQTRNPAELVGWLQSMLPTGGGNAGGGIAGLMTRG